MKLRKIAGIAAASMLLLTGCANAGGEREALTSGVNEEAKAALPEDIRNAGVLKVAVDYPYPPFAHEDVDTGEMQGLEVDLAHAIGEKLDIDVQLNKQPFDTVVASLQSGSNDIIMSGMNDTVERQDVLTFTDYLYAGFAIAVPSGNPKGIEDITDLCGLTIASQKASTTGDVLDSISKQCKKAGKPEIKTHELATVPDASTAVQAGNADGFIGDAPIMAFLAETANDGKAFELLEFATVPKGFDPVYTGIGCLKDDEELAEAVYLAMKALEEEGVYEKLMDKHGQKDYVVTDGIGQNLAKE